MEAYKRKNLNKQKIKLQFTQKKALTKDKKQKFTKDLKVFFNKRNKNSC